MPSLNRFAKHLLKQVIAYGRVRSVLIVTGISILISQVITWLSVSYLVPGNHDMGVSLLIATIVPLVAAPSTCWPLMGLLVKVHQLEFEMRQLARFDPLTKLANRRYFFEQAEKTLSIARYQKAAV